VTAAALTLEPVRYTLRFSAPHTHYVEVEAVVPTDGRPTIDLRMAVWTPGSYLVREYARHVESLSAASPDGIGLTVVRTRKNGWRIMTGGVPAVTVRYRVYGREMSVRTNWIDAGFALLNGAPTFVTLDEEAARPHDVRVELPPEWRVTATALPPAPGGAEHTYRAADYDTLVDSPIVAGNPAVHRFVVEGRPHLLVNEGEGAIWDGPRSARDAETIVRTGARFWGSLPYERYVLLNLITGASGGLEHLNSAVIMTHRWRTRTRADYVEWLGLVSHEFFHVWNGKRLRPVELGPFDYENEVHTENLWVTEGFTEYYGDLLLRRAGLTSDDELFHELSSAIRTLQTTPGRAVQPVSQASYDAWIRLYRPDENSPNVSISYYTKGGVIAFLLDAKIRRVTSGRHSLDDAMRLAFRRYGGSTGFTTQEFRDTASETAGIDLGAWFTAAVDDVAEFDYGEAFEWLGLRFRPADDRGSAKPWLGLGTRSEGGRLIVTQVRRGTPGFEAGVNVDDEIIAIDDYRVRADQLDSRIEKYHPGDRIALLVARRDQLQRLEVVLGTDPGDRWRVEADPAATPDQIARREAWLTGV
jgi:predicted metalloprotease with PDZ domain